MDIEDVFPEIETIEDETLRAAVAEAWTTAAADNGFDVEDLASVPWFPPGQEDLGMEPEEAMLVEHVRAVTACAVALAERLSDRRPNLDIDADTVVAGGLVHDVSKLYEFHGMERTEIGDLLGHPYYGVAVGARANLPPEILHIVLSHSSRTTVEPATIEAEILSRVDQVDTAAIRASVTDDRRAAR